jgi:putative transposase
MVLLKFTIPSDAKTRYPLPINLDDGVPLVNSWFSATGELTLLNSSHKLNKKVLRCRKIELYPNSTQRKILTNWIEVYRICYNHGISYIRKNEIPKDNRDFIKKVKATFSKGLNELIAKSKIPVHTFDNSIIDIKKALKTAFSNGKKFRMRYKKLGAEKSIYIGKEAFSSSQNGFQIKTLGPMKSEINLTGINHDCRLTQRGNKYYLFIPFDINQKKIFDRHPVCSLDPGLRTFQTCYDSSGSILEFCTNYSNRVGVLFDKLKEKKRFQKKSWYKRYSKRLYAKIKNLTDELHFKTANYLVRRFDVILIGNMSTSSILRGNLKSKSKVLLQSMSHYTFKKRLEAKCQEYKCQFIEVDENYTSKTCGGCGKINNNLGSSKVFSCECGFKTDRDYNGARNIMIKYLKDSFSFENIDYSKRFRVKASC